LNYGRGLGQRENGFVFLLVLLFVLISICSGTKIKTKRKRDRALIRLFFQNPKEQRLAACGYAFLSLTQRVHCIVDQPFHLPAILPFHFALDLHAPGRLNLRNLNKDRAAIFTDPGTGNFELLLIVVP